MLQFGLGPMYAKKIPVLEKARMQYYPILFLTLLLRP
jgi:hypothetical protein